MDLATAGNDKGLLPDLAPPVMDLRDGAAATSKTLPSRQSIAPEGPVTLRSAAVEEEPAASTHRAPLPRSGSDNIGAPAVSSRIAPRRDRKRSIARVAGSRDPEPVRENPVAPEVAPAVPVAIEVTIAPLPPPLPPVERIQPPRLVFGDMGTAKIDTTTDPLFGLAGLLLIPAVGAALGYRQARAAQSVRESVRP